MHACQPPQLPAAPLLPRRSQPPPPPRRPPLRDRYFPYLKTGEVLCFMLLFSLALAELGVSIAIPFNVADNRIMTISAFILYVALDISWGVLLYQCDHLVSYRQWSILAGAIIVTLLKLAAMLYQFQIGSGGENPFVRDYSFVIIVSGSVGSWIDSRNDGSNQHRR